MNLSPRDQATLKFVRRELASGWSPSLGAIAEHHGFHKTAAARSVERLRRAGLLVRPEPFGLLDLAQHSYTQDGAGQCVRLYA